ncbi:hypothetical protein Taro_051327 [Colocasia esculenta]|uniref:Uncharacterized protein n=1 Tax=Colocasia esculenta TaxID=4460 RepID=A0A843XGT5_COLES|nr:hypothetical protein [Colocasia esculenta]
MEKYETKELLFLMNETSYKFFFMVYARENAYLSRFSSSRRALRDAVLAASTAQTCASFPPAFISRVTKLVTVFVVAFCWSGKNLKNSGKNLGDLSSPRILLLLASLPTPTTPWHELGPAMRQEIS